MMKKKCCDTESGAACPDTCPRVVALRARTGVGARMVTERVWRKHYSDSQAVLPHQVPAAIALDRKLGAPAVEYALSEDGYAAGPKFRSLRQQRQWCRAHRIRNWDDN